MTNKQDFVVNIGGDAKGLDAAAQQAARTLDTLRQRAEGGFEKLRGRLLSVQGGVLALSAAFAAFSIAKFLNQQAEAIAQFQGMSEVIGDSAEALASLKPASDASGVGFDKITAASVKLTAALAGTDDESKGAGAAIKALGLNLASFKQLSPVEQIDAIALALAGFEDGASKTAIAVALFGRSGAELRPLLNDLAGDYKRQITLTAEVIAQADDFTKKLGATKGELTTLVNVASSNAIPVLQDTLKVLRDSVNATDDFKGAIASLKGNDDLRTFAEDAVVALATLGESLYFIFKTVRTIVGSFQAVFADLQLTGEFIARGGAAGLVFESNRKALSSALDRRNETVRAANARLQNLVEYDGAKLSNALQKQFDASRADRFGAPGLDGLLPKIGGSDPLIFRPEQQPDAAPPLRAGVDPNAKLQLVVDPNKAAREAAAKAAADRQNAAAEKAAKLREQILKASLDAETNLLKAQGDRRSALLDAEYEMGKVGLTAYYAQRLQEQQAGIDREITARQAQVASADASERVALNGQIAVLKEQRVAAAEQSAREEAKVRTEVQDQLDALRRRTLEVQGHTAQARIAALESEFRELLARFKADGNTEGVRLIESLINTETSRARFDEISRQFSELLNELRRKQAAIADQVAIGAITPAQGRSQSNAARDDALPQLKQLAGDGAELAKGIPELEQNVKGFGDSLRDLATVDLEGTQQAIAQLEASLDDLSRGFASSAANAGVEAFQGLFTSIIDGSQSAGGALKNFARSLAASLAALAARALATIAVLQLLRAIPGGSAALSALDVGAAVKHSGGIAGEGGVSRRLPAMEFAGARRYHDGGIAGLQANEVPAILKRGEEVLTESDPRHARNGGLGAGKSSGGSTRIINVLDPNLLQDYLSSGDGERVLVNAISRNAGAIKQSLR